MSDLRPVIVLEERQLNEMLVEGIRTFPLETGGILMGFVTPDRMVVTSVVGPGPGAIHRRRSFTPDAEWQQDRVAELYEKAGRRDTYLGDWHTHPRGSTRASLTDWCAAWSIAAAIEARCPNPVMIILALASTGSASVGAYRWSNGRLRRVNVINTSPSRT